MIDHLWKLNLAKISRYTVFSMYTLEGEGESTSGREIPVLPTIPYHTIPMLPTMHPKL